MFSLPLDSSHWLHPQAALATRTSPSQVYILSPYDTARACFLLGPSLSSRLRHSPFASASGMLGLEACTPPLAYACILKCFPYTFQ